jgi:hypothetical protein
MGGPHTRPSATCVLPDGRRFSAVLWEGGQSIQVDCEHPRPPDGGNGREPAGAVWEPSPPVLHGLHVVVTERSWGRRVIRVTGAVDATLEFNARRRASGTNWRGTAGGREPESTLHVDGNLAGELGPELTSSAYLLVFKLPSSRRALPAELRATLGEWFGPRIASLRLTIDDVRVYEEADGKVVFRAGFSELPIPASQDEPGADTLPIPSDAHRY